MKKPISILLVTALSLFLSNQIVNAQSCIFCGSNTVSDSSSAIGAENISTGKYSLASGFQNEASGDYSFASGNENQALGFSSFATGHKCDATANFASAFGYNSIASGDRSLAAGYKAHAFAPSSFAFGENIEALSSNAFIVGSGYGDQPSELLQNTNVNSFMIGFHSTKPTFFVSSSSGGMNKTGKIGIGNITEPIAKLHIKADNNEDASLFLQPTGANYFGRLMIGDENHSISSRANDNLIFETEAEEDYVFKNGSIFIEDSFEGLILKSPDGQCWKGTADNNGSFVLESIDCDLLTGENKTPAIQKQTIRIFPNPAGKKLTIELPLEAQQAYANFYNEQGVLLLSKGLNGGNNLISLKKIPHGVLIVKVLDTRGSLLSTEKIMHQ